MVHDTVSLTVSTNEATKIEEEAKRRLLVSKKLSLVVDLDMTIIHATVDPTVAEWQNDPNHVNHKAVQDVRTFQLVDDGPGSRQCMYYVKFRPGLHSFLENVSKLYECHIYTMGTRAYAQNIAKLIDPERKIFADRILSRDESGSLTAKSLRRLFPVDTKMVVIIDDRGDVWNWNENLIKVEPFNFFKGAGDINSSFLPKKQSVNAPPKPTPPAASSSDESTAEGTVTTGTREETNGTSAIHPEDNAAVDQRPTGSTASPLEQLVSMGGGDNATLLQAQINQQDEALEFQLQDRPLLQNQLKLEAKLEAEDAAAKSAKMEEEGSDNESFEVPQDSGKQGILLKDDDIELFHLSNALRTVHAEYFDVYARQLAPVQGGRLGELRGILSSRKRKVPLDNNIDLEMVPDIKDIMPQLKYRVLDGVCIVFSGVVPLGNDLQNSDEALWAKCFGATVHESVDRRTTHVVARRDRTAKVRQALKRGKIHIVTLDWLILSIKSWTRLDEKEYLLKTEDGRSISASKDIEADDDELLSESEEVPSAVETEDEDLKDEATVKGKPALSITTTKLTEIDDLEGVIPSDLEDEQSPVGGTNETWKEMHDEMAEFLGSDNEDSDADSVASENSGRSNSSSKSIKSTRSVRSHRGKKRDSDEMSNGDQDGTPDRKKQAVGRPTNLSQTIVVNSSEDSGLPTPDITAEEEDKGDEEQTDGEEGDGWSDFEDELTKELEKTPVERSSDVQGMG